MQSIKGNTFVNRILFPAPTPTYTIRFPGLVWLKVPHSPHGIPIAVEDDAGLGMDDWLQDDEDPPSSSLSTSAPKARKFRARYFPCHFVGTRQLSNMIMIYAHGNACDIGEMARAHAIYSRAFRINVLAVEYPGYGVFEGSPSEVGCNEVMRAAYDFVTKDLKFAPHEVIVFGRSIGTGIATALVSQLSREGTNVGGLILQSPYLSIKTLAKSLVGWAANLILDRFINLDAITYVKCPLLIIHGKQDTLIPYQHAERLLDLCPAKHKIIKLSEVADHNCWDEEVDVLDPIQVFLSDIRSTEQLNPGTSVAQRREDDTKRTRRAGEILQKVAEIPELIRKRDQEGNPGNWAASALKMSSAGFSAMFEASAALAVNETVERVDHTTTDRLVVLASSDRICQSAQVSTTIDESLLEIGAARGSKEKEKEKEKEAEADQEREAIARVQDFIMLEADRKEEASFKASWLAAVAQQHPELDQLRRSGNNNASHRKPTLTAGQIPQMPELEQLRRSSHAAAYPISFTKAGAESTSW